MFFLAGVSLNIHSFHCISIYVCVCVCVYVCIMYVTKLNWVIHLVY